MTNEEQANLGFKQFIATAPIVSQPTLSFQPVNTTKTEEFDWAKWLMLSDESDVPSSDALNSRIVQENAKPSTVVDLNDGQTVVMSPTHLVSLEQFMQSD
jgi:hypothetical protein